jgi:hypothetical protein
MSGLSGQRGLPGTPSSRENSALFFPATTLILRRGRPREAGVVLADEFLRTDSGVDPPPGQSAPRHSPACPRAPENWAVCPMTVDCREVYHPHVLQLPPPPEHVAHVLQLPPPPPGHVAHVLKLPPPPPGHVAHVLQLPPPPEHVEHVLQLPPPPEHVAHVVRAREMQEMAERLVAPPPDRRLRRVPRKKVSRGVVVVLALAITVVVSGVYAYVAARSGGRTTSEAAPVESAPVESAPVESAPVESAPVETGTDCEESAIATMPVDEAGACLRRIAVAHGYVVDPQLEAFTTSYNACSASSVEELAAELGTDPFAAIVADAYAAELYPEAQHAALDGCFLALT